MFNVRNVFSWYLVLLFIYITARPLTLFREMEDISSVASVMILGITFVILGSYSGYSLSRPVISFLLIFLGYNFLLMLKYGEFYPRFFLQYTYPILLCFYTYKFLGVDFFRRLEKAILPLSLIATAFYSFALVSQSTVRGLLQALPHEETETKVHTIFYTLSNHYGIILRNCGFAWEPGMFSVLLCIGVLLNFVFNRFALNRRFYIYLVLLLTTQSTTGFSLFLIILFWRYQNVQIDFKYKILFASLAIIAILAIFNLPFFSDKLFEASEESVEDIIAQAAYSTEGTTVPQRFSSFIIAFRDFWSNPVLGFGGAVEARWFNVLFKYNNLSPISGIGNTLGRFGLLGVLFFTSVLFSGLTAFSRQFNIKGRWILYLAIISISVSYGVTTPIFIMFFFYKFFVFESNLNSL